MAEYVQAVGCAFEATKALLEAVQLVKNAQKVLNEVEDRVSRIQDNLQSIESYLDTMDQRLKPIMAGDKFEQLQGSLVRSVEDCESKLVETFGLFDDHGNRRKAAKVKDRLVIAMRKQRISHDLDTLRSVQGSLTLAIVPIIAQVQLELGTPRRGSESSEVRRNAFQIALKEFNQPRYNSSSTMRREPQRHEQRRRDSERSRTTISSSYSHQSHIRRSGSVSAVDSLEPLGDNWHRSNEETDLLLAVKSGRVDVARSLIDAGAATDTKHEGDEWSLLHLAVRQSVVEMTKFLLETDPSLANEKDGRGKTPLHLCAESSEKLISLEHARILLESKADVNAKDDANTCSTPLHYVVTKTSIQPREAMAKLLIENGALVEQSSLPVRWKDYDCLKGYLPKKPSRKTKASPEG